MPDDFDDDFDPDALPPFNGLDQRFLPTPAETERALLEVDYANLELRLLSEALGPEGAEAIASIDAMFKRIWFKHHGGG